MGKFDMKLKSHERLKPFSSDSGAVFQKGSYSHFTKVSD